MSPTRLKFKKIQVKQDPIYFDGKCTYVVDIKLRNDRKTKKQTKKQTDQ